MAQLSYDSICGNEERLGLDQCRVVINRRVILYYEDGVVDALIEAGLLIEASANGTQ